MNAFDRVQRPRHPAWAAADSTYPMDVLEYQGKQLFEKHGVPVPEGRHATTVAEAAKAEALEAKGVRVGRTPTEVAEIAVETLRG